MANLHIQPSPAGLRRDAQPLKFLRPNQIAMIDEALSALGDYGELRLVVEKGRLRFLVTQKSFDVLKMGGESGVEGK